MSFFGGANNERPTQEWEGRKYGDNVVCLLINIILLHHHLTTAVFAVQLDSCIIKNNPWLHYFRIR
jgi:hypothetical protein